MPLVLTEEQGLLQQTVRDFVDARSPFSRVRKLRDARDADGFSRALWTEMGRLGWLGIPIPEEHGGTGLGPIELMVLMEEVGRRLLPEPILSTVVLGAGALVLGGSAAQQAAHLPAVAAGERLLALAYQEPGGRYGLDASATVAERAGDGWRLTGEKAHVLDGHVADVLVVSARTPDGTALFLVPRDATGVAIERQWRVDLRNAALVRLNGVRVPSDAILAGGGNLLARVVDRATIALTAAMLGGMSAAFEMTLDYLKTRQQFGVPIGSFQALKHRAAKMYVETELARSAVMAAHRALADGADDKTVARLAGVAKARASDAYILIGNESVQMHGGIGMTDEHDVGFYLKDARATAILFGDAAHHRDRVATLDGY
jgi:acyl-CoA dehydrogenase